MQREFAYARVRNSTTHSKLWNYAAEVRAAEASVIMVSQWERIRSSNDVPSTPA